MLASQFISLYHAVTWKTQSVFLPLWDFITGHHNQSKRVREILAILPCLCFASTHLPFKPKFNHTI